MVIVLTAGAIVHVAVHGRATGAIGATGVRAPTGAIVEYAWTCEGTSTPVASGADAGPKTGLAAGSYRLTVTARGAHDRDETPDETASVHYMVRQNAALRLFPGVVTHIDVWGESTGAISATGVAGGDRTYTPYWSSDTSVDLSEDHTLRPKTGLPAGDYTLRIVDGVGGSVEHTYTVLQSQRLRIRKGAVTNASLRGSRAGRIADAFIQGGVPPYSLRWSKVGAGGGETQMDLPMSATSDRIIESRRELTPGEYRVVVTDTAGATAMANYRVSEGPTKVYFEFASTRNFYRKSD